MFDASESRVVSPCHAHETLHTRQGTTRDRLLERAGVLGGKLLAGTSSAIIPGAAPVMSHRDHAAGPAQDANQRRSRFGVAACFLCLTVC